MVQPVHQQKQNMKKFKAPQKKLKIDTDDKPLKSNNVFC